MYRITLLICYLSYSVVVYGYSNITTIKIDIPLEHEVNKRATLVVAEDDNVLENCFYLEEINNTIIATLLTKTLDNPNFLLPNTNWWLLKIFFMAIIPLSASVNNLGITTHDDVTYGLILVTQFTIPLNILNICFLLDKLKIHYKQGIKNTIIVCKQNIAKAMYYLSNFSITKGKSSISYNIR